MSDESFASLSTSKDNGDGRTIWSSSLMRICTEMIELRETTKRQLKLFEQTLTKQRDALQGGFNSFAADTQRAYQQLRQEITAEKRFSLSLLNELLDVGIDLQRIVAARPRPEETEAFTAWADSVEVEMRKVHALLTQHGVHPYDAAVGQPYSPALHERVGSKRLEGLGPMQVAEQRESGWASQAPDFALRRPKVLVSE
jgi:molecular chaperone GrpE (heat shock protein)